MQYLTHPLNEKVLPNKDVVGTSIGKNGEALVLQVYTAKAGVAGIPQKEGDFDVVVQVTGKIVARGCPPPTNECARPVPIGVSTGHPDITAGTIGARVTDGTDVYALSNNHVYANENSASIGDTVIQPGTYDGGSSPAHDIGTLYDFQKIKFNNLFKCLFTGKNCNEIDAAIALSDTLKLGNATPSDGYGTPNSATVLPHVGLEVQKYGRTTSLTKGTITGINAMINVAYDSGDALFVNQIIIEPGSFSAGGDSGSLILTDDASINPVGLLFAGSPSITVANPIGPVLSTFDVTINSSASTPPGPIALDITTTSLADGTVDQPYSATVEATDGAPPYAWAIIGSLPSGLSMNTSGEITGTPRRRRRTSQ